MGDLSLPVRVALDRLLDGARGGAGGALVLRGDAGVGKTCLLEYAAGQASGMRVIRLAGVEPESSYQFAALHRLLLPLMPSLDRIPRPQRAALRAAFGIVDAAAPDLFLVGLAVLTVLSDAAAVKPLLIIVDDAQWLDDATMTVLAFVARRLETGRIALTSAIREPSDHFAGLPDIRVSRTSVDLDGQRRDSEGLYALTVRELGLGRYESAAACALLVYHDDPPGFGTQILPELVEAAVRSGQRDAAVSALDRLTERVSADPTQPAQGLLARSRALLTETGEAESLYLEAIEQPGLAMDRARAQLLYGEWLRRRRRRRAAREQLSEARESFDKLGAEAFARRAWIELKATGATRPDRHGELTPQEGQVARLVAEGSSNRQVAAQLFISQSTVEYHLQKVFRKLEVSSRTQLVRALLPLDELAIEPR
jgi:DNA-binding CsgD family transcriptional regulator